MLTIIQFIFRVVASGSGNYRQVLKIRNKYQELEKKMKKSKRMKNDINQDCAKERYPARKPYAYQNKKIGSTGTSGRGTGPCSIHGKVTVYFLLKNI
jgi:hypothetical protein